VFSTYIGRGRGGGDAQSVYRQGLCPDQDCLSVDNLNLLHLRNHGSIKGEHFTGPDYGATSDGHVQRMAIILVSDYGDHGSGAKCCLV